MISKPTWQVVREGVRLSWEKDERIVVEVESLRKERYGLYCHLMILTRRTGKDELLFTGRYNLSNVADRSSIIKYLAPKIPQSVFDWAAALEQVCLISEEVWRRGEPSTDLRTVDPRERPRWLVEPFVAATSLNLLFADGGTGKSTLALCLGVTVASGHPVLGNLRGDRAKVLYLDYEDEKYTHGERLHAICRAASIDEQSMYAIEHLRLEVPFVDIADRIRRKVEDEAFGFVILDSFGMARGANPSDADPTINAGLAMRRLGVPVLVIDHVAKAGAGEKPKPIGSVYTGNQARMAWYAEQVSGGDDDIEVVVRLQMAKRSYVRKMPDRFYRITYLMDDDEEYLDGLTVRETKSNQIPEMIERMSLAQRMLLELNGTPRTLKDLAEVLGEDYKQVKVRAWELDKSKRIVHLKDGRYAKVTAPPA